MQGKRVLVTGASGFIGSHLTRQLVNMGCEVSVLIRESSSTQRFDDLAGRLQVYRGDLRDPITLTGTLRKIRPQTIFHLAATVTVARDLNVAHEVYSSNVIGTINLLRALDGLGYECFVNTGTCEEYGNNEAPFREDQLPKPVSPYSASKAATTMFCTMLHTARGSPILTLRPFLAYGPQQNLERLLPQAIVAALQGREFEMTLGEQTREVNYVSDIVDGYVRAACSNNAFGEIINISNGTPVTVRRLVELIYEMAGAKVSPRIGARPYRENEVWHLYGDNAKARRLLDWRPTTTLEQGLERTIDWYRQHLKEGAIP
jgi:UDP-glucose 4-epimerase